MIPIRNMMTGRPQPFRFWKMCVSMGFVFVFCVLLFGGLWFVVCGLVAYGLDLFPPPTPDFLFFFLRRKNKKLGWGRGKDVYLFCVLFIAGLSFQGR